MYIDDTKLFAKNEKQLETLIHAVRIYSQDTGIGIWHWKMCRASNEKLQTTPDRENGTGQIKTRLERSEKRKPTDTCASLKLTPNKWRWKKK